MSGLVTHHLPAGPDCCLDSDWLRAVWKSTSVELQGCRPLVLPPPYLFGSQPGLTAFFPLLFAIQEEDPSLCPLSVFCGQILKLFLFATQQLATCSRLVCQKSMLPMGKPILAVKQDIHCSCPCQPLPPPPHCY